MPCIYIFRVAHYREELDWTEMNALVITTLATLWFIAADREQDAISKEHVNFRKETQYTGGSDEEDLLMSWKEADEVTGDDLRISKQAQRSHEQGKNNPYQPDSQRHAHTTEGWTIETAGLTPNQISLLTPTK